MRLGTPGIFVARDEALSLSSRRPRLRLSRQGAGLMALARSEVLARDDEQAWWVIRRPRLVMSELLLHAAGRRRLHATRPEFHAGRPPRNKGRRYPSRPAHDRVDLCGHAPRRRPGPRSPAARVDRRAVARWPAHL